MLAFVQGLKTDCYIASDEPSSSVTAECLSQPNSLFQTKSVGSMNEVQGTE